MLIVSGREFRANQAKYLGLCAEGQDVILKSRKRGSFRIVPVGDDDAAAAKKDITEDLKGALQQVKDHLDGKRKLNSIDTLIDELRNNIL